MGERIDRDWDWWAYCLYGTPDREGEVPSERVAEAARLAELLEVGAGGRLLDIGSGSGLHLRLLAKQGIKGVGIDSSWRLMRHSQERAVQAGVRDLTHFLCGDMHYLESSFLSTGVTQPFEGIYWCGGSFGLFGEEGDRRMLYAANYWLRPEGKLLIAQPEIKELGEVEQKWGKGILYEDYSGTTADLFKRTVQYLDEYQLLNVAKEPESYHRYDLAKMEQLIEPLALKLVRVEIDPLLGQLFLLEKKEESS